MTHQPLGSCQAKPWGEYEVPVCAGGGPPGRPQRGGGGGAEGAGGRRRGSRCSGLRLPEKAIRFRLVALWKGTTAPVARMLWKLIHRSVAPPVERECAVTRCCQPRTLYWRRTTSSSRG